MLAKVIRSLLVGITALLLLSSFAKAGDHACYVKAGEILIPAESIAYVRVSPIGKHLIVLTTRQGSQPITFTYNTDGPGPIEHRDQLLAILNPCSKYKLK